jgi:hypothetical protein
MRRDVLAFMFRSAKTAELKLPHDALNIFGAISAPVGLWSAERTHAHGPEWGSPGCGKGRASWLMHDPLRGDIELVAPDKIALYTLLPSEEGQNRANVPRDVRHRKKER